MDEIFVNFLKLAKKKTVTKEVEPMFKQCYRELLTKCQELISSYKQTLDSNNWNEDYLEIVEKNITVLTFQYTRIQSNTPISFLGMIAEIMNFSVTLMKMDWKRPLVPKCGMLMLFASLKVFDYYTKPGEFPQMKSVYGSLGINHEDQLACYNEFFG